MQQTPADAPRLERSHAVVARTGHSRTEVYRLMRIGKFPRSVKISARGVAWPSEAIDAYIAARKAGTEWSAQ